MRSAAIAILYVQGALLTLGGLVFGLAFPLLAGLLWGLDIAPPGEDPLAIGLTLGIAGPITALFYLPGGVASLLAAYRVGRAPDQALVWVVVAAGLSGLVCSFMAFVPVLLLALEPKPPPA